MAWNSYPKSSIAVDRIWNINVSKSQTTHALQVELRKTGYLTTAYALDGQMGPATIKAWQRYLRDKGLGYKEGRYDGAIDGKIGPMMRTAIHMFPCNGRNPYGYGTYPPSSSQDYFPIPWNTDKWQGFLNFRRNKK